MQNSPGILKTKSAQISQEKPLRKKYPKITYHLQNPKKEENMQYVWHDHLEQLGKTQKQVWEVWYYVRGRSRSVPMTPHQGQVDDNANDSKLILRIEV